MKDNHINVNIRLDNKIRKLENKLGRTRIGNGNPYYKCKNCGVSEPQISISGHFKNCIEPGILKEIEYYKNLKNDRLE